MWNFIGFPSLPYRHKHKLWLDAIASQMWNSRTSALQVILWWVQQNEANFLHQMNIAVLGVQRKPIRMERVHQSISISEVQMSGRNRASGGSEFRRCALIYSRTSNVWTHSTAVVCLYPQRSLRVMSSCLMSCQENTVPYVWPLGEGSLFSFTVWSWCRWQC